MSGHSGKEDPHLLVSHPPKQVTHLLLHTALQGTSGETSGRAATFTHRIRKNNRSSL